MPQERRARFPSLYAATLAPLRRYLARLLGNHADAQDIAHDAYARVYALMNGRWPEYPEAYLFTTARRLALNQIRRRRLVPPTDADQAKIIEFIPAKAPAVERVVMAREEWLQLEQAISRLPPRCRHVLLLRKIEQLTHVEIAARLGISVSTVEKQHARALRLLQAYLDGANKTHQPGPKEAGDEAVAL